MKIKELLREYNETKIINDFGAKLMAAQSKDQSAPKASNANQLVHALAALDPTGNKELTFWLAMCYATGQLKWEDIASRAVPALIKFKALLKKPNLEPKLPTRDINQIKSLLALEDIIELYPEKAVTSSSDLQKQMELNFYKTKQADLIYNSPQLKIVVPETQEASCFLELILGGVLRQKMIICLQIIINKARCISF